MTQQSFKVAAVQAAPVFLDLEATIDKAIEYIADAAAAGASLVAFPEVWFPGYPWYAWLDVPAVWMQKYAQRYFENSLEYGTPQADRLSQAARDHNIMVSAGISERSGGSLYISQWLIGADGRTLTQRRKLKPTHVERVIYGEGDGSDLVVAETELGRVGGLCCWEHFQPLSKYAMYAQHEQVHIGAWPSFSLYEGGAYALGPEVNTSASRTYAVEGQVFVIAPCATVSQVMVDEMCETEMQRALLKVGGGYARIYGPDGQQLHESLAPDVEGLVYADLDLGAIAVAKVAGDPVGHYSRPDATRLVVNRTPRIPMTDSQAPRSRGTVDSFADALDEEAALAE
ncbi:carbon-nitrogen hydrolase family protein [Gulosibacter faecalis]|jgi:aliphatic nitrilase|uniref:Carbon-nitrogen hydrolase family protein n=1 Tax=Gulosibacter faecalis TaxID=272240 RepID=A0ABW5UXS7_9MICO|nr:carbon-nitrogen hydrolase family protein [Gulosibacter faecalis]